MGSPDTLLWIPGLKPFVLEMSIKYLLAPTLKIKCEGIYVISRVAFHYIHSSLPKPPTDNTHAQKKKNKLINNNPLELNKNEKRQVRNKRKKQEKGGEQTNNTETEKNKEKTHIHTYTYTKKKEIRIKLKEAKINEKKR